MDAQPENTRNLIKTTPQRTFLDCGKYDATLCTYVASDARPNKPVEEYIISLLASFPREFDNDR
jgi:hypothetical protein